MTLRCLQSISISIDEKIRNLIDKDTCYGDISMQVLSLSANTATPDKKAAFPKLKE